MSSPWIPLAERLSEADKDLRPFIARIGPPKIELETNAFRALAMSILSQQLAPKASQSIINRVVALAPPFPGPVVMAGISSARLRKAGVSPQKLGYLRALCRQWTDASWRRGWNDLPDEALVERLVQVKGIGEWTAHMFLIFSLGRPDVLPVGDFGVRKGVQLLRGLKEMPAPKELPALVESWKGASSVGAWYLWRALDQKLFGSLRS